MCFHAHFSQTLELHLGIYILDILGSVVIPCLNPTGVKVFRPVTDFRLSASQSGCSCDSCRSALKKIGGGDRPRSYHTIA